MLIRLHGWFAYSISKFSHDLAQIIFGSCWYNGAYVISNITVERNVFDEAETVLHNVLV